MYLYIFWNARQGLNQISSSCSVPTRVLFLLIDIDPAQNIRNKTDHSNSNPRIIERAHRSNAILLYVEAILDLCCFVMAHVSRNETARAKERSMSWRPPSTSASETGGSVMKMIMNSQDASEILEICSTRW